MEHRGDPVRWLSPGSEIPEELRRVMSSAKGDGGGSEALTSLAAKLPLAPSAVPTAAASGAIKKAVLSWKLAVWVAGAAAAGGAATNLVTLATSPRPAITAPASGLSAAAPGGRSEAQDPGRDEPSQNEAIPSETGRSETASGAAAASETGSLAGSSSASETGSLAGPSAVSGGGSLAARALASGAYESGSHEEGSRATKGHEMGGPSGGAAASSGTPVTASPAVTAGSTGAGGASSPDSLGAEARLLLAAKRDLARDPERALRVAERHDASFGGGALAEEREVLRIEALVRLGKRDEAARLAASFRAAHPQSTHLARLERLLRAP